MSYVRILGGTAVVSAGLYAFYNFRDGRRQVSRTKFFSRDSQEKKELIHRRAYIILIIVVTQNPFLSVNAAGKVTEERPNIPLPSRSVQISALKNTPEFDVLVIGGGATGCGVALDSVTRGI